MFRSGELCKLADRCWADSAMSERDRPVLRLQFAGVTGLGRDGATGYFQLSATGRRNERGGSEPRPRRTTNSGCCESIPRQSVKGARAVGTPIG